MTALTAVVTGGASGIGLAMTNALLSAGWRVAVWSRGAQNTLCAAGSELLAVGCDVTCPEQVWRAVAETTARFGRIDCGITAAGINAPNPFVGADPVKLRRTLDVNLTGTFLVLQALARHMAGHGEGSLIALSSIAALRGQATTSDYAASKAAVRELVMGASRQLRPMGVRANVITPGYVVTPLLEPYLRDPRFGSKVMARIPLGRMAQPHELGALALMLADPAAIRITGSEFIVDGGYTVA